MIGSSLADATSIRTRSRVLTASRGLSNGTAPSLRGSELSSRLLSRLPTLNSMTLSGMTSSPSGNGAFASLVSTKFWPATSLKSMTTSKRSAMPIVRSL